MHVEICACLRLLARLNYIMGDHPEVRTDDASPEKSCYLLFVLFVGDHKLHFCITFRPSATSKRLS